MNSFKIYKYQHNLKNSNEETIFIHNNPVPVPVSVSVPDSIPVSIPVSIPDSTPVIKPLPKSFIMPIPMTDIKRPVRPPVVVEPPVVEEQP